MYQKQRHIHFIGIGGIGMSGIATILRHQGYRVSGCDKDINQQSIYDLKNHGCSIYHGNDTQECSDTSIDIIVYSSAIKNSCSEIIRAQQRGIPTIHRALMLAELMRTKYSIAIAGSHGKTTTASLISHIMLEAKKDPTIIVGGRLKNISANAYQGTSDLLVAEADESDRSLTLLKPTLALITNIDAEHLDVYTDIDDIKNTFKEFLKNVPFYGKAVLCADDSVTRSLPPMSFPVIWYGIDHQADFYADTITLDSDHSTFDVYHKNIFLGHATLSLPGKHNILNSLGAIALAREFNIPFELIAKALQTFKGIERRFSFNGLYRNAEIFDDYGHHPEEIKNTLLVARKRSKKELVVVFQPHRFTRTHKLWDMFLTAFAESSIDKFIITDIYCAGEEPIENVTSKNFAEALSKKKPHFPVYYIPYEPTFDLLKKKIDALIQSDDLLLLLGAGKINNFSQLLLPSNPPQNH